MTRSTVRSFVGRIGTAVLVATLLAAGMVLTAAPAQAHSMEKILRRGCDIPLDARLDFREVDRIAVTTPAGKRFGVAILAKSRKASNLYCAVTHTTGNHHGAPANWTKSYIKDLSSGRSQEDHRSTANFGAATQLYATPCIYYSGTIYQGPNKGDGSKAHSNKNYCG